MSNENERSEIEITIPQLTCKSCIEQVSEDDAYCQHCGYPLKGTQQQQVEFIHNRDYKVLELNEMNTKINSASTTLFVLAAVFALSGLFYFAFHSHDQNPVALLITNGMLAVIFLGLGIWCKNHP